MARKKITPKAQVKADPKRAEPPSVPEREAGGGEGGAKRELREKILSRLLVIIALGGAAAYLPSAYLSIRERLWLVLVADTLACAFFFLLAFGKGFSYRLKVLSILIVSYLLGLLLLVFTGPFGAGHLYVFAFVFTASLFGERRTMILANILAILTHLSLAFLTAFRLVAWPQNLDSVLVISANFIFVSLVLSYSANFLVRGYAKTAEEEKRLREVLEATVRELEHRTKNNIQFLSSLVGYLSRSEEDPAKALRDIHESLSAIGVVQSLLRREDASYTVNLETLFSSLIDRYRRLYKSLDFDFQWAGPETKTDGSRSVSLGVLLNEIVTNAVKHAYPAGERGRLFVRVESDPSAGMMRLAIGDEGRGIGEEIEDSRGMGRTIIETLARELHAEMRMEGPPGLVYRLEIPLKTDFSREAD